MQVTPIQFLPNGNRCLWDEKGNARVMRADYAANDNEPFFRSTYQLVRETEEMIEQFEERIRQEFIQQQLITRGRI